MKKLYQIKVTAELLVPHDVERSKFLEHIEGGENGLITKTTLLAASENPDDAILDALKEYLEKSTDGIEDYMGIVQRGETRGKYYLNVSLRLDEIPEPIETKLAITLEPEDLGI